jgi:tetratricopeptide (TPR) repeat protein
MNPHFQRATVLMRQGRLELAIEEFRKHLGREPGDPAAHGSLALCLADLKRFDEAQEEAGLAIRHAPELDFGHYAMGWVLHVRNREDEAARAAEEAIRIDPEDADNWGLLASIRCAQKRWQEALDAAEQGLALDPVHGFSANQRAIALRQLGRREEAGEAIDYALAQNPEDAVTHTNAGWTALQHGDARKALDHFREALRLDPTMDHARSGIVEAIKARNPAYAFLLRYVFWMSRLSGKAQWAVIIGAYVLYRILTGVAKNNPDLKPWLVPVIVAYVIFALFTWIGGPLSNLLLRLHPYGRLALSREQILASNILGLVLAAGIVSAGAYAITGSGTALFAAIACGILCIPVSGLWNCAPGWPRRVAAAYAVMLATMGILAVIALSVAPNPSKPGVAAGMLSVVFLIGAFGAPWITNILMGIRGQR